jgi:hypothetical protein
MPKRIPIKAAREISAKYDLKQVIILAWDGKLTHVVTYGKTMEDCDQAAQGGNKMKKAFGWPESLCQAEPSRVKKMKKEIKELKQKLATQNKGEEIQAFPQCANYEDLREELKGLPDTWYPDLLSSMVEEIRSRKIFKEPDGLSIFLRNLVEG